MKKRRKVLKVWIMPNAGYETASIMEKEIEAFEDNHPHIKIDITCISWTNAWSRIIWALKYKQLPDVFQIGNTWTQTLAALHALYDLTEKARELNLKREFLPAAWMSCESKLTGKVWSLPWFVDVRILFYRKDVLKKSGLSVADLNDWQGFEDACLKLNGIKIKGKILAALGISDQKDQGLVHDIAPWIWASGGDFLNSEGKKATFNQSRALKGMEFYFSLVEKGYAPLWEKQVASLPLEEFFVKQIYVFMFGGAWSISDFLRGSTGLRSDFKQTPSAEKFGFTFLPKGPSGRYTFCGGSNLVISNFTNNFDLAWEFINFLSSFKSQIRYARSINMLPSNIKAFDFLFTRDNPEDSIMEKSYKNYSRSYIQVPSWATIEMILAENLSKVMDALKFRTYTKDFLKEIIDNTASTVDYILSL